MKKNIFCCLYLLSGYFLNAQVDLLLHLKIGEVHSFSIVQKSTISQTVWGVENKSVNTITGSYSYKVLADWDSLFLMETWYTELSQKVESEKESVFHSSSMKGSPDVMCTVLSRVINKPFRVVMRHDFSWKEVTGLDSIFLRSYSDYYVPAEKKHWLDSTIIEGLKASAQDSKIYPIPIYPSRTIKPNEVWTVFSTSEHVVPTNDSCNYYLSEIYGDNIVIKGNGTASSTEKETVNEGIAVSYHLSGPIEATASFDKNTKWLRQSFVKTEMQGNAEYRDTNSTVDVNFPMKITTELFVTGY